MKKKLKGFTLVEVIVALAVFSVMALLLATMYTAVCAVSLNTNNMNKKVDNQVVKVENPTNNPNDQLSTKSVTFTLGGSTESFNIDVYEQDKYDLAQAILHKNAGTPLTDREKELLAAKDSPNVVYFNLKP